MALGIAGVRAHLSRLPPAESLTTEALRAQYDRAEQVFTLPPGTRVEPVQAPVPGEWLRPPGAREDAALLYLHGGGYCIGSPRSHRHLAAALASAAGVPAFVPDYRLAPEHPFPAALEDAAAACRWLLGRGLRADHLALAGDSAGGGLTLATMVALREAGAALPAAAACLSPWTDLAGGTESYRTRAARDPIVKPDGVLGMARAYLGDRDPRTPLASPVHADLRGLPPLLIQVGSEEILLDDATGLADRARAAGVEVALEVWDDMIHVWHWFLPWLDEAQAAVDKIGAFFRARLG
jgi:phosphinothricin tripeptide acetyl hydrolase